MFAGFDYGTSNCAIAVMREQKAELVPLEGSKYFIPSTLYAFDRALVADAVARGIPHTEHKKAYIEQRQGLLGHAQTVKADLDIRDDEITCFMGDEAIAHYTDAPSEGWFVKSPKSFLGASRLQKSQILFFEDIVSLMMQHVKKQAENQLGDSIEQAVIGRPINFQGTGSDESNQQAIAILERAARNAGFKHCEFFFEPLAAGIDFEPHLSSDKTVLILDIGGGTSDCSIVQMGPTYRGKQNRNENFLAHSGIRIGGNDLDIDLNLRSIMPLFGKDSLLKNGLPVPSQYHANAAKINDVNAQTTFNSAEYIRNLEQLLRDAQQPELIRRLQKLQQKKQSYQLSRTAELAKIELSTCNEHLAELSYVEDGLKLSIQQRDLEQAVDSSVKMIMKLMREAITQAACQPDIIYITGGSAKSPIIRRAVEQELPGIEIIDGDFFGSVAAGLGKWAEHIYR